MVHWTSFFLEVCSLTTKAIIILVMLIIYLTPEGRCTKVLTTVSTNCLTCTAITHTTPLCIHVHKYTYPYLHREPSQRYRQVHHPGRGQAPQRGWCQGEGQSWGPAAALSHETLTVTGLQEKGRKWYKRSLLGHTEVMVRYILHRCSELAKQTNKRVGFYLL